MDWLDNERLARYRLKTFYCSFLRAFKGVNVGNVPIVVHSWSIETSGWILKNSGMIARPYDAEGIGARVRKKYAIVHERPYYHIFHHTVDHVFLAKIVFLFSLSLSLPFSFFFHARYNVYHICIYMYPRIHTLSQQIFMLLDMHSEFRSHLTSIENPSKRSSHVSND